LTVAGQLFSATGLWLDLSVGTRSSTKTVAALLKAFLDQRTWKQADLARRVEVAPATIRKRLLELQSTGIPLTSEDEHPHVYWSVPKSWYPGGVLLGDAQITELLRLLARLPKSKARDQVLETLLRSLPARPPAPAVLVPAGTTAREEQHVPVLEDAASKRVALRFSYYSAHTGKEGSRHASVHRVLLGPPARFIALCHRASDLRWFRVENVTDARLDEGEPFRHAAPDAVEAFQRASLDGFHDGGAAEKHVFFVSDPDSRWVERNLLGEMQPEQVPGGIRVTVDTAGVNRLARYLVGLGGSAKALTETLRKEAAAVALAAARANESV
jgi:predicted DNA-binding transcriptional regulator YafY